MIRRAIKSTATGKHLNLKLGALVVELDSI